MIRITVTDDAYQAIAATTGAMLREPQRRPLGGVYLWLDADTRKALDRVRERGEDYSATILRLAQIERAQSTR